jgi:hypothetical protein
MFATLGMGKLPKDEIRSTVHLPRELTEQFEKACEKKYGKDWKKKTGYKEAMQNFVKKRNTVRIGKRKQVTKKPCRIL